MTQQAGSGDVPLTVFQSLPVDSIIIVTSPQDLVSMIVKKAVHMAQMMNIPIIGLVENMSYTVCPHCSEKFMLFGDSHKAAAAAELDIPLLDQLPLDPDITALCDQGHIERLHKMSPKDTIKILENMPEHG